MDSAIDRMCNLLLLLLLLLNHDLYPYHIYVSRVPTVQMYMPME